MFSFLLKEDLKNVFYFILIKNYSYYDIIISNQIVIYEFITTLTITIVTN